MHLNDRAQKITQGKKEEMHEEEGETFKKKDYEVPGGEIIFGVEVTEKVRWKWQKWQPESDMHDVEVTEFVIGNDGEIVVGCCIGIFEGYEFKKLKGQCTERDPYVRGCQNH